MGVPRSVVRVWMPALLGTILYLFLDGEPPVLWLIAVPIVNAGLKFPKSAD